MVEDDGRKFFVPPSPKFSKTFRTPLPPKKNEKGKKKKEKKKKRKKIHSYQRSDYGKFSECEHNNLTWKCYMKQQF